MEPHPLSYHRSGKVDIVIFFLVKADPKIEAKDGYTMMHAAAFLEEELVQLAYDLGLDINALWK